MSGHDDTIEEAAAVAMNGAAAVSRVAEAVIRQRQEAKLRQAQGARQAAEQLERRYEAQARGAEGFFRAAGDPRRVAKASPQELAATWRGAHLWAQVDPPRFTMYADQINAVVHSQRGVDGRRALSLSSSELAAVENRLTAALEAADRQRDAGQGERGVAADRGDQEKAELAAGETSAGPDSNRAAAAEDRSVAASAESAADRHDQVAAETEGEAFADYDTSARREATARSLRDANVPEDAVAAKMTADQLHSTNPSAALGSASAGKARRPARGARKASTQRTRVDERTR